MSNCTQACMCSGWCFWTYFTAIANAIGASFVVADHSIICPHFPGGKLQIFCIVCPLRPRYYYPCGGSARHHRRFRKGLFSRSSFVVLCLNARSEPPCRARFFVKYFCPNEWLWLTRLFFSHRASVFANTTKQQCSGHNTHQCIGNHPWWHG